jgi:nitrite reductase (NO-forming)
VQGEFYTKGARGEKGLQAFDSAKAYLERPEYVIFNGRVGALADAGALAAKVGDMVRIFAGNAGPNLVWSFHVIGEIFDRVYAEGGGGRGAGAERADDAHTSRRRRDRRVQGGSTWTYLLVDHSIFRIDKGAVGMLKVEGTAQPGIFAPIIPGLPGQH